MVRLLVERRSHASTERRSSVPSLLSSPAPRLSRPLTSLPIGPFDSETSLPFRRKSVAGSGMRISNGAPTARNVSSSTPPYSMATAPVLTVKPSPSTLDARPPTRSRDSTSSVRYPWWARRAAADKPPAPAPMTSASYGFVLIASSAVQDPDRARHQLRDALAVGIHVQVARERE